MDLTIDFLIAGVQKGGTTALDSLLRNDPKIQMASVKETHFFDDDNRDWSEPEYAALHHFFDWSATGVLRGEATPIYTYWPNCLERIRNYKPSLKLILSLRHPSFRAYSHWRMETTRRWETLPFHEAIRNGRARCQPVHRRYSYVERGLYAGQIERVLSLFPRDNVLFLTTDDLWRNPTHEMNRIASFLRASSVRLNEREYIVPLQSAELGEMAPADREFLDALFRKDIEETAWLTGLDLSNWLRADYQEPMTMVREPHRSAP
jgi:hypothetical protein